LKKEKHRRDREFARRKIASQFLTSDSVRGLTKLAARSPFGPVWVSSNLFDERVHPALITVLMTRAVGTDMLGQLVLVDRTCLGVKNAFVMRPMSLAEVEVQVDSISRRGDSLQRCEPQVALSAIYHAIEYARTLGFSPHKDFEESLLGPRPTELLDTPMSTPPRPIYWSGPDDDVTGILQQLTSAVGEGNYQFVSLADQAPFDGFEPDQLPN
jgi:hypothetical protein